MEYTGNQIVVKMQSGKYPLKQINITENVILKDKWKWQHCVEDDIKNNQITKYKNI